MAKLAAVELAASTRLRPVLMTTVATVVGHFPLTLVTGAGAVARNSIGLVGWGGCESDAVHVVRGAVGVCADREGSPAGKSTDELRHPG